MFRKLPIGIQSFEKVRDDHFLYVDKTKYIYQLAQYNVPYFLSRPRRFGKSLLLSALSAFWEGKKELFAGLEIERLVSAEEWPPYPVFYFDFNRDGYSDEGSLESVIEDHLETWEGIYGRAMPPETDAAETGSTDTGFARGIAKSDGSTPETPGKSLALRFSGLLARARAKTGRRCVVLVDEYDRPLLQVLENEERLEHNKAVFKNVFGVLKSADMHIQFIFITGVTKFSKVSIFSDLNNLNDISLDEQYADICGISDAELRTNFIPEIKALAKKQGLTEDECLEELGRFYDGYRFHHLAEGVYNPFSLFRAFYLKEFGSFWFETGTPTFLMKRIKKAGYDVRRFEDSSLLATRGMLSDYRDDNPDLVPLLYQTGYLTIRSYDVRQKVYVLGFPNEEVKFGFYENLLPEYIQGYGPLTGKDIFTLDRYIQEGDTEGIRKVFVALFASIPYTENRNPFEHYFQTVLYLVFTLLGRFSKVEMHTYTGRIDCVLETDRFVYLFEFKRDLNAEEALRQIEDNDYAAPFAADSRRIIRIGVNFDSSTRMISEWKVQ